MDVEEKVRPCRPPTVVVN